MSYGVGDACAQVGCAACISFTCGALVSNRTGATVASSALAITFFVIAILAATPTLNLGGGTSFFLFILSATFLALVCCSCRRIP